MGLFDFFNKSTTLPASQDEWIILVSHKIKRSEDGLYSWDADAPIILEFVPIIAWQQRGGGDVVDLLTYAIIIY